MEVDTLLCGRMLINVNKSVVILTSPFCPSRRNVLEVNSSSVISSRLHSLSRVSQSGRSVKGFTCYVG